MVAPPRSEHLRLAIKNRYAACLISTAYPRSRRRRTRRPAERACAAGCRRLGFFLPVDAGRLHRDVHAAMRREPVAERNQVVVVAKLRTSRCLGSDTQRTAATTVSVEPCAARMPPCRWKKWRRRGGRVVDRAPGLTARGNSPGCSRGSGSNWRAGCWRQGRSRPRCRRRGTGYLAHRTPFHPPGSAPTDVELERGFGAADEAVVASAKATQHRMGSGLPRSCSTNEDP